MSTWQGGCDPDVNPVISSVQGPHEYLTCPSLAARGQVGSKDLSPEQVQELPPSELEAEPELCAKRAVQRVVQRVVRCDGWRKVWWCRDVPRKV